MKSLVNVSPQLSGERHWNDADGIAVDPLLKYHIAMGYSRTEKLHNLDAATPGASSQDPLFTSESVK